MTKTDDLADQVHRLFSAYEMERGASSPSKVESFSLAVRGQKLKHVKRAVDDFLSGNVRRKPSVRGKLPTSEEFGGYIRDIAAASPTGRGGEEMVIAAPFGPLWGVKVYQRLLSGPDDPIPPAPRFIQQKINEGFEIGESYRLHHQASVGFKAVNLMFDQAGDGKPSVVEKSLDPVMAAVEPVPVDGYRIGEWRSEHGLRGWPWFPAFGQIRVVYLPTGGPEELANFENVLATHMKPVAK